MSVLVSVQLKVRVSQEQREEFKSKIQSFNRLYSYISQIINFTEVNWEKLYVFFRFLNNKLPKGLTERISIIDSVDLGSLRIQMFHCCDFEKLMPQKH